jgi:molecular chaperone Hsp33
MIIQMLPEGEEGAVDALEAMIRQMKPITTLIGEVMEKGKGKSEEGLAVDLMAHIFREMPQDYQVEILETKEMKWDCDCSMERLEQVLMTIGYTDLKEIIEEDGQAEMVCQFCRKKYLFDKAHLERILESIS